MLVPPSVKDFVPEGHLAHFVRDVVRDDLDLSAIFARYTERRGQPPYHPALMTSLLLYAYSRGIYSSRRIERAREERVDFMALTGVEAGSQVIVCHGVKAQQNDHDELMPMVDQIEENTGRLPDEISADTGYCSEGNIGALEAREIRGYIATGRQKHGTSSPTANQEKRQGPRTRAMRTRLRRGGWRSHYRLRKHTVEPVFGQIKEARGFRQFLRRGLNNVAGEWALLCTVHNLLKLAGTRTVAAS